MSSLSTEEHKAIEELASRVEAGDYYAILGVDTECNQTDLKKAYYDLSRRFHPDRFYRREVGDLLEQIEEVFTGINISFEVLSDDVKRRRFDLETQIDIQARNLYLGFSLWFWGVVRDI